MPVLCHFACCLPRPEDSKSGVRERRALPNGGLGPQNTMSLSPAARPQIQTALRHKSEIEHHRNKIRLRAKRRGHYEFPVVDELSSGDTKERHRVYRRAQMQIDKILDPTASVPSVFIEPRKRWARPGTHPRQGHRDPRVGALEGQ